MFDSDDLDGPEIFDITDVDYDWVYSKSGKQISLILKSETRFNLMKTYLSLRALTDKIENEIGMSEPDGKEH